MKRTFSQVIIGIMVLMLSLNLNAQQHFRYRSGDRHLIITFCDERVIHFNYEYGQNDVMPASPTLMIDNTDCFGIKGINSVTQNGNIIETEKYKLMVNPVSMAVTIYDKFKSNEMITTFSASDLDQNQKLLTGWFNDPNTSIYGLGEQFSEPLADQFSYKGKIREGDQFGNRHMKFNCGMNSNAMFPVMYALSAKNNFAVFLDNIYRQQWNFTNDSIWKVRMAGGSMSFYLLLSDDLQTLRKQYMSLTGHPTLLPRKAFGMWMSEYGYDDWNEIKGKLKTLRENDFMIEGFILDLQWFGNILSGKSAMGCIRWDTVHFPSPEKEIIKFKNQHIGIIPIQEPLVDSSISDYASYKKLNLLVKDKTTGNPLFFDCTNEGRKDCWWGKGGELDFSNGQVGEYIFQNKTMKLIQDGVSGIWCDLGEPEYGSDKALFNGNKTQYDVNNIFNLMWVKSIFDGYKKYFPQQRCFTLTRTGTSGQQRFGAAMWSGDIASRMNSLKAHSVNQANMSLSGIDWYGSDIGGFWRHCLDSTRSIDSLYTRWFAYSCLFDLPVRPHTFNVGNMFETAPDRVGNLKSNLANNHQRYRLLPYYYSLAYDAYKTGEAMIPPLVYYFTNDKNVHEITDQKMIGAFLMGCAEFNYDSKIKQVYLPAGIYFDWYSHQKYISKGEYFTFPLYRSGLFTLPLFAVEGAIIPVIGMKNLQTEINAENFNTNEILIFPSSRQSSFNWYEDDGVSRNYEKDDYAITLITQVAGEKEIKLEIASVKGTYHSGETRNYMLRICTDKNVNSVTLNGNPLPHNMNNLTENKTGWFRNDNDIIIYTGDVSQQVVKSILLRF